MQVNNEIILAMAKEYMAWEVQPDNTGYRAFSMLTKKWVAFSYADLDNIDNRLVPVLQRSDCSNAKHATVSKMLKNSVQLWENKVIRIEMKGNTYYCPKIVSVNEYPTGEVEVMFKAFSSVWQDSTGILVASAEHGYPNQELSWDEWDRILPGIRRYYGLADALDLAFNETAAFVTDAILGKQNEDSPQVIPDSF